MPETVVTGKRMTQAKVAGISANIPAIPLAAGENASQAEIDRLKMISCMSALIRFWALQIFII